jgi:formate hydrogenlyase subunit 6/NADH:ubiquinone oxidoreductase subunit I
MNKKDTRNKKWIYLTYVAKGTNFIAKLFNKKQTSMYPYEIKIPQKNF